MNVGADVNREWITGRGWRRVPPRTLWVRTVSDSDAAPHHAGYLDGKALIRYGRAEPATIDQVRQHLRKQPTFALLRLLGRAASAIERADETPGAQVPCLQGVPLRMGAVSMLALLAIEASNDHRRAACRLDDAYVSKLFDLAFRVPGPPAQSSAGFATEFMLRAGEDQFVYQGELRHQLPRIWLILSELWPNIPEATSQVPTPLEDFKQVTGLALEEAVVLGFSFAGSATDGVVEPFAAVSPSSTVSPRLAAATAHGKRDAFIRWASADYDTLRKAAAEHIAPSEAYVPFRFNPLRIYPIVRPSIEMAGCSPRAVLLPVKRFIFERVTLGAFHVLADYYNTRKGNAFRNAFGHVFQAYVGRLLREALTASTVLPEWKYDRGRDRLDSPDWIVVEGQGAVVIEAKQSALFLSTKQWGDAHALRADLGKSIARAVGQLARFQADVAGGLPGLEKLKGLAFELVVVTFDRVHYANSVVRDEIDSVSADLGLSTTPHVHIIPVEAFEYLLGACDGASLFDLLGEKRRDAAADRMDVDDWLHGRYPGTSRPENKFLTREYAAFWRHLGIRIPPVAEGPATASPST